MGGHPVAMIFTAQGGNGSPAHDVGGSGGGSGDISTWSHHHAFRLEEARERVGDVYRVDLSMRRTRDGPESTPGNVTPEHRGPVIWTSPAELHPLLKGLGENSSECEVRGVDFLWVGRGGLFGCQRKSVSDLLASRGDRLPRELGQMAGSDLVRSFLLVEGDTSGEYVGATVHSAGMLRAQWVGMLMSLQCEYGVGIMLSESVAQSAETLRQMESWTQKHSHGSLSQRSKSRAVWGNRKSREWSIHVLQSFDGLSVGRAGAIYDSVGLPLMWTVDWDVVKVPGVGPKTRKSLKGALDVG